VANLLESASKTIFEAASEALTQTIFKRITSNQAILEIEAKSYMSFLSPKNLIKRFLANQGYEASLHRITNTPYTGQKVAFIHIAKCGGSSVDFALRSALAAPGQRRIDKPASIVSSMATFEGEIASLEGNCKFSEHHAQHLLKILSYYLQENWQYISGHVTINAQLIERFKSEYAFITILRDPVKRFISNYTFNKLTNKKSIMLPNSLNTDTVIQEANEILNSQRGWQMANSPTMYLTGRYPTNEADARVMQQEVASNLAQFKVVGFLDDLDAFTNDCQKLTGRNIDIGQRNSTENLNSAEQQKVKATLKEFFDDKGTKNLVNKLCQFESENYLRAKELQY